MMIMVAASTSYRTVADDLVKLHADCRAAMATMHILIKLTTYDGASVPAARYRMSHASTQRLRFLCDVAYPCALKRATPPQVDAIRALQSQATANRVRSSDHVAKWSSAAVSADWNAFRSASAGILQMMTERLEQEQKILMPLLRNAGA